MTFEYPLTIDNAEYVTIRDGAGRYFKFPSLTTTQKTALSAKNGMVVYDSDLGRLEAYQNGSWGAVETTTLGGLSDVTVTSVTDNEVLAYDSATGKWINQTAAEAGLGAGSDTTAIHDNVSGEISAITEKTAPVAADKIVIEDSAAANAKKMVQIGNLSVDDMTNDAFNKFIQSAKVFRLISFDTYDMVNNAVAGSGVVGQSLGMAKVDTGTTANSYAGQNFNRIAGMGLYSGDKIAWYIYITGLTGDTVGFVGTSLTLHTTETDHTWTVRHAGLFYDNGVFYASTGDGTSQELTTVTSFITSQNWLKIMFDGTYVRFYWGDTLIATHTTYTPGGYQEMWVSNKAGTTQSLIQAYAFFKRGNV